MKDSSTKQKPSLVGGMGSMLNLDLSMGASRVLERLHGVNPGSITNVSVEYNLMAELVFDQEWMEIMEAIGSLPFINTVSLSFRIPVPLPMEAFTKLIEEAVSMETLNLVGLQLSEKQLSCKRRTAERESPVEAMIEAFRESEDLQNIQLRRYRPVRSASTVDQVDPLLFALSKLPHCKVFHTDHANLFADPSTRDLVFRSPFQTIKIGPQEKAVKLQHHFHHMAVPLSENLRLKELIIQEMMVDEALAALAELLQNNRTLEKVSLLRLQSRNFGNLLGAVLAENTTLQSLELNVVLRDRVLFRQNVKLLASSLGGTSGNSNSALTTLKLNAQGVRSSILLTNPFLEALTNDNFILQNLLINRNSIPLGKEIAFFLKLNQIGRNYFLRRPEQEFSQTTGLVGSSSSESRRELDFREEWVHMLIEQRKDVRVLHYFISLNPTILPQS